MIQAFLANAEKKQQQNEAVKLWLKRMDEVAYEADDVFDELNCEILRRRVEASGRRNPYKHKVCLFFSFSCTLAFRRRLARKVKDINLKLKSINEEAVVYGLQSQIASESNSSIYDPIRVTDSVVDQNVVGRGNDATKMVEKLFDPSVELLSFLPITGLGGIGKTTLAQLVYNDAQVDNHFDRKIWVSVSDNFDVTRVLKLILESLSGKEVNLVNRDTIVQEIKKELTNQTYLLVLDDVWCECSTTWDDFRRSLVGSTSPVNGNWSLVTTRSLVVASNVTAGHPFALEGLSGDDCWRIFIRKACLRGEVPEELNVVKEGIIGACRGVPLVASVLGGLFRISSKEKWLSMAWNEIPGLLINKREISAVMQILKLSFDHLPSAAIKKCFAYCSLFEKDFELEKDILVQLWMAEGFLIQSNHGNEMEMETIGSSYFDILVSSSLFEEGTREDGTIFCKMHDLIHDLAQLVSKSETIILEKGRENNNCQVRYVALRSLRSFDPETSIMLKERSNSIRTVFVECPKSDNLLTRFTHLRVPELS